MSGPPLTLVVMAAGVGSRFGGTKQLAEVGPNGEALLDYTVADARRAGFEQVVLVVRSDIRGAVADHLARSTADAGSFVLVCQDEDPRAPARERPWGTGHAVLVTRDHVPGPFAVVNADDYYGAAALEALASALRGSAGEPDRYHLIAYELARTLSPRGTVSRGVCDVDPSGRLVGIVEHAAVGRDADGRIVSGDGGPVLSERTPVSMNLWGLKASVFPHLAERFTRFVEGSADDPKAELQLPTVIGELVRSGTVTVQVHPTPADWLGVTYAGDLDDVRSHITELVDAGSYPELGTRRR